MGISDFLSDSAAQRKARSFDKLVSKTEEENILSWQRVADLAAEMKETDDERTLAWAQELAQIAQNNLSLVEQLGFELEEGIGFVLPSGVETTREAFVAQAVPEIEVEEPSDALIESLVNRPATPDASSEPFEKPEVPVAGAEKFDAELPEMVEAPAQSLRAQVATFRHVCDGRDGKLVLFEDEQGHLVAVRASRLV